MKRNDIKSLHKLTTGDLQVKLQGFEEQLAKVKLEKKVGKLANSRLVSHLCDDIARVRTIIRELELKNV